MKDEYLNTKPIQIPELCVCVCVCVCVYKRWAIKLEEINIVHKK
jgi:hypothetical protein